MPTSCIFLIDSRFPKMLYLWAFNTLEFLLQSSRFASPIDAEKEEKGYSLGWLHHKGRNKHHWEYWLDFGVNGIYACKMPTNYVIEMFCDRVAASMIYQKEKYTDSSALEYYENGRGKILIHPETDALIHHLLKYLSEHGLDQTIHYIVTEIKE